MLIPCRLPTSQPSPPSLQHFVRLFYNYSVITTRVASCTVGVTCFVQEQDTARIPTRARAQPLNLEYNVLTIDYCAPLRLVFCWKWKGVDLKRFFKLCQVRNNHSFRLRWCASGRISCETIWLKEIFENGGQILRLRFSFHCCRIQCMVHSRMWYPGSGRSNSSLQWQVRERGRKGAYCLPNE